ncbi:MAG: hypothetical protein K2X48_14845 [Chitinophagaceae bacterium]|nr:hypothetical protein [Chitinophagaceae bacterium]
MKQTAVFLIAMLITLTGAAQETKDTLIVSETDTALRIRNLNPYFTLHVDSSLSYKLEINKDANRYYWFLKNSPLGLRINKDNGLLTFKADKAFFQSGKLKYDQEYKVLIGVQNLYNPQERTDTSFTIVFFNTEVVTSKIRPSVSNQLQIDEGDTLRFEINCENASFPLEFVNFESNVPVKITSGVHQCGDVFNWAVPFDFVKDNDSGKVKIVLLRFTGADKFRNKDTSVIRVIVRDALNYPLKKQEYEKVIADYNKYIQQLKLTFRSIDKKVKRTRNSRLAFDMTSASTAMVGTVLSTSSNENQKNAGRILPGIGVTLVPVKEAITSNKIYDQNSASLVRSSIRRLEYLLSDNILIGEKDPDIVSKTTRLRNELKQIQIQLIDVPMEELDVISNEEASKYFEDPKVNKKYRVRKK